MSSPARSTGLGLALAAGLPGVGVRTLADAEVLDEARDQRAVATLSAAAGAGALDVAPDLAATLVRDHESAMYRCVLLERALAEVAAVLAEAGVGFRVLKGPAVAALDYPDPSWRAFGDLDLLVSGADYDRAVAALVARGARRRSPEARPGFDRRFGKGVCLVAGDGLQIDLHRMLAPGPFGFRTDLGALLAVADDVELGGTVHPTLTREHRFLHACLHAVLGDWPPRVVPLRDVAQLRLGGHLDWDAVLATAAAWQCRAVVARAVLTSTAVLALDHDAETAWAAAYVPTRFERHALAASVGSRKSYARQSVAALPAVGGWRDRAAYARALLFPERSYLDARDGSYLRRAGRAWTARRRSAARS